MKLGLEPGLGTGSATAVPETNLLDVTSSSF
jgi:hypothetical protein